MNEPKWDGQRWRIRVMQDGKTHSFSCKTPGAKGRKEVTRLYHEWLYGEGSGEKTVNRVAQEYLEDLKARRGADCEAYIQNERYIRLYIAPICGQKKISKMTQRDWQTLINEATGANNKPLSHKTLMNLRGIVSGIVKFGYQDYQCEPLRGNLYIPVGHARNEKAILQEDDIQRLLEPSDKWYHPLFCFLAITGMRPGEALGLQVDDVLGSSVRIRRAVNARGKITEGKNENAKRIIPIGALARSILRKTIRRNEDHKLHTEWIFCDLNGNPGNQSTMRNQWNELKKERDLPGTVYSLRHTFISMMKNVMPEQMIKDIVGHSVSMDTFGTYGHIIEGDSNKAAKIIDLKFKFDQDLPEEK
jgi:integrase